MTAAENTVQASKEVSELKLRVQDLGDENRLLIEILNSNGVQFMDRLEAHRHKREFKRYCGEHPLGITATAEKIQSAAPVLRNIAWCDGSVLRAGLIAKCFFVAFKELTRTAELRWRFGGRLSARRDNATPFQHGDGVTSLAVPGDDQLASGSIFRSIKTWDNLDRGSAQPRHRLTLRENQAQGRGGPKPTCLAVLGSGRGERQATAERSCSLKKGHLGACSVRRNRYRSLPLPVCGVNAP